MKRLFKNSGIVILLLGTTIYLPFCKKEETPPTPPVVATTNVSDITSSTALIEETVINDGGTEITDIGICWGTSPNPTIGSNKTNVVSGSKPFTCIITGLTANTKYYVRAYATNSAGTSYGNEVTFTTNNITKATTIPTLTTTVITSITSTTAVSGGNITDDGGGNIIAKGISWSITPNWDIYGNDESIYGNGPGSESFVSNLSNLNPGTTYYVKAYAVNSKGIAFGPTLNFTTDVYKSSPIIFNPNLSYSSVSDVDGNTYKTIQIGNQTWMAENLKATKYNDGTSIPNVTEDTEWSKLTTGGYSWYSNDASSYKDTYGALYNWYAITDDRKLCPAGWHVPTDGEWSVLLTYLDGALYSGAKLKEAGITHWLSPNVLANNESGFTALPGGFRFALEPGSNMLPTFTRIGNIGVWWSAAAPIYGDASFWSATTGGVDFRNSSSSLNDGVSVRCLKN